MNYAKVPKNIHQKFDDLVSAREKENKLRYGVTTFEAIMTGKSASTMYQFRQGTIKHLTLSNVMAFMAFYDLNFDELFGDWVSEIKAETKRNYEMMAKKYLILL